ncbi:non-homologous end-joining DNA ligase [Tuberibacillus calidus]|jgi:DNA ligase D|uniref:non-homologous end-joining DNA ligase n=1 Tax=Tuberibacillus calidus TaxID=340097 RepID=UPI00040A260C|nr:non-homologous end-joining DNA ligase [Tuberibacillus calidus]
MPTGRDEETIKIEGETIHLTSLSKPLWPKHHITKADYLQYVATISDVQLPFLRRRALTLLRYPHGAGKEKFFQKNCPDYAPAFIKTAIIGDIRYIVGDGLATLMWLANQLAFEIHTPFQTVDSDFPSEIVLDLDPPSRDAFELAIEAALIIKNVLDRLQLISFVKTSGNKGLQIYIPLPDQTFTFEDTRRFTQFIADYLTETNPRLFTTERLKKHRQGRLYVDAVQFGEGKTIIAPYSVRGNDDALVACPLYWEEVTPALRPEQFPLPSIKQRLETKGCPFQSFFEAKKKQPFQKVLDAFKANLSKGVMV